jgi:nucleoid DNA-binding protein
MAYTNTAQLSDTIQTVISEARYTEQIKEVISGVCWKITKPLHDGSTINLPYWGTVSANNLSEGIDMVNPQAMEDTNIQFTPGEVGAQILLTDKVTRDNNEDVLRAAGRILGEAMIAKREQDLAGQFADATTDLGGTGSAATLGIIAAARATLAGNSLSNGGPAPMPYGVIHHPYVLLDLVDALTPTAPGSNSHIAVGSGIAEDTLANYTVGRVFGMPVMESANISIDGTPDAVGVVLSMGTGGGLVLATANEWGISPERDESLRATELNVVGEYAVGEYLPGWLVSLTNDATAPA